MSVNSDGSKGVLEFTVPGRPQPQGSKVRGRYGNIHEANDNLRPWRDSIVAAALAEIRTQGGRGVVYTEAVTVEAEFHFPRPRSHYRSGKFAAELSARAPKSHGVKPDLDKLVRAVGDSLVSAGAIRDDAQIWRWRPVKVWDDVPCLYVLVYDESEAED